MKRVLKLFLVLMLFTSLVNCGGTSSSSTVEDDGDEPGGEELSAEKPVISPASGTFTEAVQLTITCEDGYEIAYTTDGEDPIENGYYTSDVDEELDESGTYDIRAVVVSDDGKAISDEATATIVVDIPGTVGKPYISVSTTNGSYSSSSTTFSSDVKVTLSAGSDGDSSKVYYTIDGTDPSSTSTNYTESFALAGDTAADKSYTIRAIGYNSDGDVSPIAEKKFTISYTAITAPSASLSSGEWDKCTIKLTADKTTRTIVYTTDGSDPVANPSNSALTGTSVTLDKAMTLKMYAKETGCKNSSVVTYTYTVTNRDVYISGADSTTTSGKGAYWKNGQITSYDTTSSAGYPEAINVSGSDVITAGYYINSSKKVPCYWTKSGVRTNLDVATNCEGSATSIIFYGSDTYVMGSFLDKTSASNPVPYGVKWQTGVTGGSALPTTIFGRCILDGNKIVGALTDLATTGTAKAGYFENVIGTATFSKNTEATTPCGSSAVARDADGNTYFAINKYSSVSNLISAITSPSYYSFPDECSYFSTKTNIIYTLATDNEGIARAICTDGTKVYVAGVAKTYLGTPNACIWINQTKKTLEYAYSDTTSMTLVNGDLYITGFYKTSTSSAYTYACYWLDKGADGVDIVRFDLTGLDSKSIATDIKVVTP